ncbi:MAG: hypothetical protein U0414_27855 [Polyangiaceae bacterium]
MKSTNSSAKRRVHLFLGAPAALLVLASPALMNCSALGGLVGAENNPDCSADFDAADFSKTSADANLKGFLDASAQFNKTVNKVEVDLVAACTELGKAIGVPDEELKHDELTGNGDGSKKVCGAVAKKISATIKGSADATISVEVGAPSCGASIDTLTKCWADCGSPIEPGKLEASCTEGKLSGECSGKCEGSCTVDAGVECKGTCGGSCEGKCDAEMRGTCSGTCTGKCDGKDSKGKCAGTCDGKCDAAIKGSCSATCEGKCDASCTAKASAECKGTCEGHCDVEMKAPKCSGKFEPPKVSIDCQAKCALDGVQHIECTPPSINVVAKGNVTTDLDKLVLELKKHLPKVLTIALGSGKAIINGSAALAGKLEGLVSGAASLGIHTAGCVGFAAKAMGEAAGKISASVDVSVSVKASASGSAGASTK